MLDFGIAKVMSDDRQVPALTAVGQTLGTLEFMSPEQLRGQKLDGRSDIYALGMMAYEMLTGELPFAPPRRPIDIINFHMKQEPPAPSTPRDNIAIPGAVDAIILKMVQRIGTIVSLMRRVTRGDRPRATLTGPDTDKFEVYGLLGVVGTVVIVVATLVYFLHR